MKVLAVMLLGLSFGALADRFVEFELCKHQKGTAAGPVFHHGFSTKGKAFVSTRTPVTLIPLKGVDCVLLDLSTGGSVAVIGTMKDVHCKLRGGPGCPQ